LQDGFFNIGLATVVGIFCVKCLVIAGRITAKVALFAVGSTILANIVATTKRTTQGNVNH
jgi:hypothetical protein